MKKKVLILVAIAAAVLLFANVSVIASSPCIGVGCKTQVITNPCEKGNCNDVALPCDTGECNDVALPCDTGGC